MEARLVLVPGDPETPTSCCEADLRTALARGLADYIRPMVLLADEGRRDVTLKKVLYTRAEYEELAEYPSAVAYVQGSLQAGDAMDALSPMNAESYRVGNGTLQINGEATGTVVLELYGDNPVERMLFAMALESMAHPCDWRAGFLLELPYYFNQRASYVLQSVDYQDSDQDAQRGYWKLVMSFQASLAYTSWREFPNLDPRANIAVNQD